MRLRLVFSEALRSITANLSTTFAAAATILIGMFLVGFLIGFGSWARSWSEHTKKQLLVHVYFCTESTCPQQGEATAKQIDGVRAKLEANPLVKPGGVQFVSKKEALRLMKKRTPELVENISYNPLPNAWEVTPKKGEYVDEISRSLQPLPPGVHNVNYGKKTASRILKVARVIEVMFGLAIAILLVAATLLIANTIRLSIFARRREVEVMKLVGASNWFVRGPFMLEGLLCGLIGSIGAVALLVLGKELALPTILGHIDTPSDIRAISFALNAVILVLIGLLLGAAGSGITLRRFLRV